MGINRVTITGADDNVDPEALIALSQRYPFVEWGILLSAKQQGSRRFPSRGWMNKLCHLAFDDHSLEEPIRLSGHLCGKYVKDIAVGMFTFPHGDIFSCLGRLQLNFHAENLVVDTHPFMSLLMRFDRPVIFQIDGVNDHQYKVALAYGVQASPLFDLSHGAGRLPERWPDPISGYCGYAGGLGPENLQEQLEGIRKVVGANGVWIDMETKVRSNGLFDLEKVETCLQIADKWREAACEV